MNITQDEARAALWRAGELSYKMHAGQIDIREKFYGTDHRTFVINCSRQIGKCLAEGTLILTPGGPVPIEKLKIGDTVYGYNQDGSVTPTKVTDVFYQGRKEVVDLVSANHVLATSTLDHKWLTKAAPGKEWKHLPPKERRVKEFFKGSSIVRRQVSIPCGNVHEPHAYAIGALLGDGCSRQGVNKIHISSSSEEVPMKVAACLNVPFSYRQNESNFTWVVSNAPSAAGNGKGHGNYGTKVECHYYEEWIKGRKAHEKIVDWNIIDSWDRTSCLQFLAGLLDTDGTVFYAASSLQLGVSMQAVPVIEAVKKLIFKLWQYQPVIVTDNRSKYKNGPVLSVMVKHTAFSKLILKELNQYLTKPSRKWKAEYETLPENTKLNFAGVRIENNRIAPCWDISVDNETHLYLTAYGLVTHNSYGLCLMSSEVALRIPGAKIKYAAPTQRMVKQIILPHFKDILKDCPDDCRPEWQAQNSRFVFPNGSMIDIAGTDAGNIERLRGTNAHLCIVDEAGFSSNLDYVVKDVMMPMLLTTKGRIIIASTPAKTPRHPFEFYAKAAIKSGSYIHKTIYDNPLITYKEMQEFLELSGGAESTTWRREYLAEFIVDADLVVVPEFTTEIQNKVVVAADRPPFFDCYVSLDPGSTDLSVALFGYYDFLKGTVVFEDEVVMDKIRTDILADAIKGKEKDLWGIKKPYFRVCDAEPILIRDLDDLHGLRFITTDRDNKEASINELRTMIQSQKIIINPKCVTLIAHLQSAIWDSNREKFARITGFGHFDAVDAALYFIRNIRKNHNPYPPSTGPSSSTHFIPEHINQKSATAKTLENLLLRRK